MSHHPHRSDAPLGVKILAFLTALDGLMALLQGIGTMGVALPLGLALVGIGVGTIVVAAGLWQLEPYAYAAAMVMFGLGVVLDLFTGNLYGAGLTAVDVLILYHYRGLFRN